MALFLMASAACDDPEYVWPAPDMGVKDGAVDQAAAPDQMLPDYEVIDAAPLPDLLAPDTLAPDMRPAPITTTKVLSSSAYTGRKSGTAGGTAAAKYIASLLAGCGLEPFGDTATSYLHQFKVTPIIHNGPMTMTAAPTAGGATATFTYRKHWRPGRLTAGTNMSAPVTFVGYGLNETKHDDYKGMDVTGQVVLALRGCPPSFKPEDKPCGDLNKLDKAHAKKAKAFIILAEDGSVNIWGGSQGHSLYKLPVVVMKKSPAVAFLPAGKTVASIKSDLDTKGPQSFKTGYTVKLLMSRKVVKDAPAYNVVARLRTGPASAKEHVVSGAHYDHLGFDLPPAKYFPGALDNASGTAVVIDAACRLAADKNLKLKRHLVFALWGAEEDGLIGSGLWLNSGKLKISEISHSFNLDMVGGTGGGLVNIQLDKKNRATLEPPLKALAIAVKLNGQIVDITSGSSDHAHFVQKGIPTVYLNGPFPSPLIYHTTADTTVQLSPKKLDELGAFLAAGIKKLADL